MKLLYTGPRVRDLDRSIRFYRQVLGMRLSRRGTMSHGGRWVELKSPGSHQRLELNWYPPGGKFPPACPRWGKGGPTRKASVREKGFRFHPAVVTSIKAAIQAACPRTPGCAARDYGHKPFSRQAKCLAAAPRRREVMAP